MNNKTQLFCMSFAGGTASFFDEIEGDLPALEVVKLEYAGHGARHREPFYPEMGDLADDMFRLVKQSLRGGDYALFGYSMGAIAVAEVARRIVESGNLPWPRRVFLAAHGPRSRAELQGFSRDALDEWVRERTIRFGGIPEKLIHNRSFWRVYLPIYRADYAMIGRYRFEDLDLRAPIPATLFYAETDTPAEEMALWQRHFTGECSFFGFEGTHFFIREHHQEMAHIMTDQLTRG